MNEAWANAGFDESISGTLINKMRSVLGLTGNLRGKRKATAEKKPYTGKKRGRKPKGHVVHVESGFETHGFARTRTPNLNELEADLDRLVFKVMGIGDLPQIEDSLRQVRRLLYGKLS